MKLYSLVPRVLQTLAWGPSVFIFKMFCQYHVHGRENLRGHTQAIFACNHSGELDPIVLTAATLPAGFSPMFYVGAPDKEFADSFFGWRKHIYKGWFFRSWGSYPIVRGVQDYAASLAAHEQILKDGYSLCIFPEGGVSTDGTLREGKGGVSYLLHATGVPVIPVRIRGTARLADPGIFSGRKRLSVSFGRPLDGAVFTGPDPSVDDFKDVARRIMQNIAGL